MHIVNLFCHDKSHCHDENKNPDGPIYKSLWICDIVAN